METPLLHPKLKTALSCLFDNNSQNQQHRHEAHEFLLSFKSCNVRRLVVSRLQSQRDKLNKQQDLDDHDSSDEGINVGEPVLDFFVSEDLAGSVYLSCLALLLEHDSFNNGTHDNHRPHEKIFAAQTLNHRCRSIKINESFDIEAEDGVECGVARLVLAWDEIRREKLRIEGNGAAIHVDRDIIVSGANDANAIVALGERSKSILKAWMERYIPMLVNRCGSSLSNSDVHRGGTTSLCNGTELLAVVLEKHTSILQEFVTSHNQEEKGEERVKGTLEMLSIAVAIYTAAFYEFEENYFHDFHQQSQNPQQKTRTPWANAVLSELGSALSITALRIRYHPTSNAYATPSPPSPSCPPLVDMLVQALDLVKVGAQSYFEQKLKQTNNRHMQSIIESAHLNALQKSFAACLKALPETVLLPPGLEEGHRIPSVDRACLRAASIELRNVGDLSNVGTGIDRVCEVLSGLSSNADNSIQVDDLISIECFESWARFVTVPIHVVEMTVGRMAMNYLHISRHHEMSIHYQKARKSAFQYVTTIFEGASPSLTSGDILAALLGVAAGRGVSGGNSKGKKNPSNKKKIGNRSKKRHEARLGRVLSTQDEEHKESMGDNFNRFEGDSGSVEIEAAELLARKNSACYAASFVFGISMPDGQPSTPEDDWGLRLAATSDTTSSHEICSTITACATSVLPYLLSMERDGNDLLGNHNWRIDLFTSIMNVVQRICQCPDRNIRALAYEPLMILHKHLNAVVSVSLIMENIAVDAICNCVFSLAKSCGYPDGYFNLLSDNNDEELEIERNDVRDVVRSISSFENENFEHSPSIMILKSIIHACNMAICESNNLPPETAVHILSALAKPLNTLAAHYKQHPSSNANTVLKQSLQSLYKVCERINSVYDTLPVSQTLPVSRLALMGVASFAPMFSSLTEWSISQPGNSEKSHLAETVEQTLRVALQSSIIYVAKIPELMAESTLDSTRYDIKGTMRGPGGEDHVGCIALIRLSFESDNLAYTVIKVYGETLLDDLFQLYERLKESERERPIGCVHGKGVTPMSRRLVLNVISRLALIGIEGNQSTKSRAILNELMQSPLNDIATLGEASNSDEKFFRMCEAAIDLSFFSPELIVDLFLNNADSLGPMINCLVSGYSDLSFTSDSESYCIQWGRLRGGVMAVLRTCVKNRMTDCAAEAISALINAEYEAAIKQCTHGHQHGSNFFNDHVIGEITLHAGAYTMIVGECFSRISSQTSVSLESKIHECRICIGILRRSSTILIQLLLNESPEAHSHLDPRPTIAESWFLTMNNLMNVCKKYESVVASLLDDGILDLVSDSLSIAISLLFLKDIGDRKSPPPIIQKGMSLDGPQTLALMDFASEAALLGAPVLSSAGRSISSNLPLLHTHSDVPVEALGAAIISAGLLRAASGALPPWAVEGTPVLFRSLYTAFGKNCDDFIRMLNISTELRISVHFGGVASGQKLAGRYFEKMHATTMECFLSKTREVCLKGEWMRLKVILKSACGGKKKLAGFNLKPQYTTWECERI